MCVFTAGCDIRLSQCSCSCFTDNLSCCSPSKRCRSLYLSACCWLDVGLSPAPHSYFKSRGDHGWTFSSCGTASLGPSGWFCENHLVLVYAWLSCPSLLHVNVWTCARVCVSMLRLKHCGWTECFRDDDQDELPAVTTSLFCHIVIILNKRWWLMKLYNSHG